jgi:hypothetical protein
VLNFRNSAPLSAPGLRFATQGAGPGRVGCSKLLCSHYIVCILGWYGERSRVKPAKWCTGPHFWFLRCHPGPLEGFSDPFQGLTVEPEGNGRWYNPYPPYIGCYIWWRSRNALTTLATYRPGTRFCIDLSFWGILTQNQ